MSFGDPRMLWLLLVLPPAMVAFFWWSARKRQALMRQFIRARLLPALVAGVSSGRQKIRMGGLVLAVVCLILALARPRWGYELQEVTQRGLDIVVAIDTSKSMMAQDITPNRLARAKLAALDLMQQARSDRLGLVAFAGTAFLQCPLTIDDTAFRESLEGLNVNTIPEGGTALAQAIETAQRAFKEGDNYRILVMFTDGEDLEPGAVAAARAAAAKGLRIFTVGVGTAEGDLIRVPDSKGQMDFVRDENGNVVKSHLNTTLLEDIARATAGGFYLPLQGANTIDVLYQRGLAPLPRSESKERWLRRPQERYQWPLALAIALLVGELLFPERKRPARGVRGSGTGSGDAGAGNAKAGRLSAAVAGSAALVLVLWTPPSACASPASALRDYQSGKYEDALKQYEQSLQKRSDDLRLHFNAGAAAYQDQKFDQAARYFGDALASPDLKLQQPAYYNLGNTLYHLGEQNPDPQKRRTSWEDALKQYDNAIKLNTNDADASYNYEFVKQRLEELKKQQQQQQQQQQNQNQQNQNQNQQNQQDQQDQQNKSSKDQQQNQQSKNDQQQNQQSKSDQQRDSQSQQKQNQQAQQQQQSSAEKQDTGNQPQNKDGQQAQEQKGQDSADKGSEQSQAAAPGQMTPKEAKQLLDSQKDKDLMLPVSRKQESTDQQRVVRDW